MIQLENNTTHEQTKVFYGGENVVGKVLRLFSNTKSRIDACVDHTRPSLAIETEGAKDSFIDARNRGITLMLEIEDQHQGLLQKLPMTIFPIAKS
jgi:two-component system, OmpR family, sensor histidine kinase VicK